MCFIRFRMCVDGIKRANSQNPMTRLDFKIGYQLITPCIISPIKDLGDTLKMHDPTFSTKCFI